MSQLQMPYQCVVNSSDILIAARGSSIDLFSLKDGSLASTWDCPASQETKKEKSTLEAKVPSAKPLASQEEGDVEDSAPPAKKRKLSTQSSTEIVTDSNLKANGSAKDVDAGGKKKKQSNRAAAVTSGLEAPAVIALAATTTGSHVIAVTGEDKSIRVFEIKKDGTPCLVQISRRAMPKRPCSITISADDSTIISADKFGDVYALPLIYTERPEVPGLATQIPEPSLPKNFVPAANELTIHSQRNRKALENQRKQTNTTAEKSEPTFEHTLLLGHVSMLTDIALVSLKGRNYIVTADRDEHIRISRGIPQAHIIEGFCLGHTNFITRLCFPRSNPHLLISGGGDDELFVWDWLAGRLLFKADLKKHVYTLSSSSETVVEGQEPIETSKIAVSGIVHTKQVVGAGLSDVIIVTCEGVPALFTFLLNDKGQMEYLQTVTLLGNALTVSTIQGADEAQADSGFLVSMDTVYKPGSTTEPRGDAEGLLHSLQSYKLEDGKVVEGGVVFPMVGEGAVGQTGADDRLGNLLYNLENLRKREGDGRDD